MELPYNIDPEVALLRSRLANAVRLNHHEDAERLRPALAEAAAAAKRRAAIGAAIDRLIAERARLLPEDVDRLLSGLLSLRRAER